MASTCIIIHVLTFLIDFGKIMKKIWQAPSYKHFPLNSGKRPILANFEAKFLRGLYELNFYLVGPDAPRWVLKNPKRKKSYLKSVALANDFIDPQKWPFWAIFDPILTRNDIKTHDIALNFIEDVKIIMADTSIFSELSTTQIWDTQKFYDRKKLFRCLCIST